MTLADALHRPELARRDAVLAVMYLGGKDRYSVAEITNLAIGAGFRTIRKWNVSALLCSAGHLAVRYPDGWSLTTTGVSELSRLGIAARHAAATVEVASDLRALLTSINNERTRSFVGEAVGCFESGFYRAAVVLAWVGAVSVLHAEVVKNHLAKFNAEAKRQNPKWKDATTEDHLGLMDEGDFLDLLASPNVGVLGKNVKEELKLAALKLRNGCGHPNSMVVGRNKVSAHLEFLTQNVFSKFL